jgi:Cu/Ag efflux pump CusA
LLLAALAGGLIVLGIVVLPGMHADAVPELTKAPVLEVQTEALGLSSQEVEQYITVPLENNLLDGVMGVWDVRSQSVPGLSTVDLYFEPGTTTLHARQLVEERLTNAFSLPNVASPPQLIQPLSTTSRALLISLSPASSQMSPLQLSYLARWVIKPRLSGVPGVANVAIFGQQDRQIQVQVNPSKLAAHNVTLQQIINTAGNSQLVSPLSFLEGSAPGTGGFIDGPNQRLEIRPVLPLGAPKNMAALPISDAPGNQPLGSVANLVESHQPLIGDAITNRGPGLILLVQKLPSASVLGVTRGVEQALAELKPGLRGVNIDTSFFAPATYASGALHNLAVALVIAAVLGIVALGALLLEARAAFITALSAALSLLIAALLLQLLGYTLNALVVLGLLIAGVVVVDDGVGTAHEIVASVRRRASEGSRVPIQDVIVDAGVQQRGVLTYATVIVLLLIAPVFFSKGLSATFVHPMALSYVLAVLASMVVASTFAPAMGMLLFDRVRSRRHATGLVSRINAGYERVVSRALVLPRGGIACVCLLGLLGWFAVPFVSQPAPPRLKDRNLVVQWAGPTGASLPEMNRITARAIGYLRSLTSVSDVSATLGRAVGADQIVDTNSGQIYVAVKPGADYDSAVSAVRAIVQSIPGMHASVSTYEGDVEAGVFSPASNDVSVRVYGENYGELRTLATQIQTLMSHVGGLGRPALVLPAQEPNIEVVLNDAQAHAAGVLPGDARRQASTLVSGLTVGHFFEQQAVFDVVVIGVPPIRGSVSQIRRLLIDTSGGGHVRLGSIANVTVHPDPIDVEHQALSRFIDVSAPVRSGSIGTAQASIRHVLSRLSFPLDYHAEIVGGTPENPTSHAAFLSYVFAAALGILLLLQAAFGSWRLAAMFLLAVPVALVGGLLVAVLTGQARSLGADGGLLAVLALALRQGMLQISAIRRAHAEDGGPLTASLLLRAVSDRLGLSLTSTLVIAAGLLPFVVMGDVAGNEITHAAADVILGGLVTATLLSQVLIPALYLALGPTEPITVEPVEEDREPLPVAAASATTP